MPIVGDYAKNSSRVNLVDTKQLRAQRARAHHLKPVVIVGSAGISEPLLAELERALDQHELIKVRITAEDRVQRDAMIQELCARTGADLIQRVGHIAVVYRKRSE